MGIYEIICGSIVLLLCLLVIVLCLMQDAKSQQNMTSAITGGSNESFYGQNQGRTKEAILQKTTRVLSILAFVTIIAMNIVIPYILTLMETSAE